LRQLAFSPAFQSLFQNVKGQGDVRLCDK